MRDIKAESLLNGFRITQLGKDEMQSFFTDNNFR